MKAKNDTVGSEGLVPLALVFGEFLPLTSRSETAAKSPRLQGQSAAVKVARDEMGQIML